MSFSGQTVAFPRRPLPPQGRSRRSLHRGVLLFTNPSPFTFFLSFFLFWSCFRASSTMVPDVFWVLGHLPTQAAAHAARPRSYGRRPPAPRAARPTAGLPAASESSKRRRRPWPVDHRHWCGPSRPSHPALPLSRRCVAGRPGPAVPGPFLLCAVQQQQPT